MKKPWQIWALYSVCLLVVVPAMVWLSFKIIQLDRLREDDRSQTELARREAELQERISSALWRMDWLLTPLVAQEAARPYYLYDSFYPVSTSAPSNQVKNKGKGQSERPLARIEKPSPLLFQPSEFVVLHFQIGPDNQITSPQRPQGTECVQAINACGLTNADVIANDEKLNEVKGFCSYQTLIDKCPSLKLPNAQRSELVSQGQIQWFPNAQTALNNSPRQQTAAQYSEELSGESQSDAAQQDAAQQGAAQQGAAQQGAAQQGAAQQSAEQQGVVPQGVVQQSAVQQGAAQSGNEMQQDAPPSLNPPAQTMYVDPQVVQIEQKLKDFDPFGKPQSSVKNQLPIQKRLQQQSRNVSRGQQEFSQRRRSAENNALNQWLANNRIDSLMTNPDVGLVSPVFVREGIMRPLWVDDKLILVRQVDRNDQKVIQCCWLDWEKIEVALRNEVRDLLPEVEFEPVLDANDIRLGQTMATLPVQLVVNMPDMIAALEFGDAVSAIEQSPSGLRMSLVVAWCGLAFAAIASALLLRGVLRLSERRGAFVSAVTHELRTPLTSFRMYAEMLAEKMVSSEEKQQQYAHTLKIEAERLSHLVENVLQFARLERGARGSRNEKVSLGQLLDRFGDRLSDRAQQAGMRFEARLDPSVMKQDFSADPAAIEQILFNLIDNACKYAKNADDKTIELSGFVTHKSIQITVRDHGPGVNANDRHRMFEPFRKSDQDAANTAPGVGLGLALCRRMAKSLGGSLKLGQCDQGATFILEVPLDRRGPLRKSKSE